MTKKVSVFLKVAVGIVAFTIFLFGAWYEALPSTGSPGVPSYTGFSAIDPSRNQFVILGDTRGKSPFEFWLEKPGGITPDLLREVVNRRPAFVINLGDLVLRGGSSRAWFDFDKVHAGIRQNGIPYFPILGNHEMQGNTEAALQNYFNRFPYLEERRWYSFRWKNIGLIMLDSNISTMTSEKRAEQMRWYTAELERFEADTLVKHVIVCTHEPPYTNRVKTAVGVESATLFAEPFLKFGKTRILFSGHVHSYERFMIGSKHFVVSGGGGAPRGKLVVDPNKRRYEDQFSGEELRFFHFCLVEIAGDSLLVKVLRLESDGSFSESDHVSLSSTG